MSNISFFKCLMHLNEIKVGRTAVLHQHRITE